MDGVCLHPVVVEEIVIRPPSFRPATVELLFLTNSNHRVIGLFLIGSKKDLLKGIVVELSFNSTHCVEPICPMLLFNLYCKKVIPPLLFTRWNCPFTVNR